MPSLKFKGKSTIVNYHLTVPYHHLRALPEKSVLRAGSNPSLHENMVIHGDNLLALKALMPTHGGRVNCIYIDPPYNTGNEGWAYNDNVNGPQHQRWLGKTVDREDLTRHDKWLCMMWPRLSLLYELLAEDGVIFVSIDDNEVHHLRMMMDEVFGEGNFITGITRITKAGGNKGELFKPKKDHVLCYAKRKASIDKSKWGVIPERSYDWLSEQFDGKERRYILGDTPYRARLEVRPNQRYYMQAPDGSLLIPPGDVFPDEKADGAQVEPQSENDKCWSWSRDRYLTEKARKKLQFKRSKNSPFLDENGDKSAWTVRKKLTPSDVMGRREILSDYLKEFPNSLGTADLASLEIAFGYPKPCALVKHLIERVADENAIILDSFAGSGTTAHAVMQLNAADGGNRKFVLVECEDYADGITAERVRRVIGGVPRAKDAALQAGLGGHFGYWQLGAPLEYQSILEGDDLPSYEDLARYIFYTATGEQWSRKLMTKRAFVAGESAHYEVHLWYKPDVEYLRATALTLELAEKLAEELPAPGEKWRLVFAPACYANVDELARLRIKFCRLPFEIYRMAN